MPINTLVDDRTGIVRRVRPRAVPAHFPRSFTIIESTIADTARFSPWISDTSGAGYAFDAPEAATAAAIGEAVERYCGNLVPPGLERASYHTITSRGDNAIDPDTLALFTDSQRRVDGFPFTPFTRDLEVEWTWGRDLRTGERIAVPAGWVWVSYHDHLPNSWPRTNPIIQAGLATGPSREEAEWSGLCEVIERDAMTISWVGRRGVRRVEPPRWLRQLAAGPRRALTTRFYEFPNDSGLWVTGALVRDEITGYLCIGMGSRTDLVDSMVKAFGEALQLQLLLADYDDPDGPFMRAAAQPSSPLKPWRPDRDYSLAYRPDLADAVDYGCHLQLFLDPAIRSRFERELDAVTIDERPVSSLVAEQPVAGLMDLVNRLAATGHRVVAVDVTTPDVRATRLHVVRVLVPGYYSNSATGLPFLGGSRLSAQLATVPGGARQRLPLPH